MSALHLGGSSGVVGLSAVTSPMPRKEKYHHGNLREQLLEVTARLLEKVGASELSLREIARAAKVSHAAPAHHFKNKKGLLTAFAAQGYLRMNERIERQVSALPPERFAQPRYRLAAMGVGYVSYAVENPQHFDMMFRLDALDPDDPAYVAATDRLFAGMTTVIGAAAQAGELGGKNPEVVGAAAWSLAHGLATLWISGRMSRRSTVTDPAQLATWVTDLFVEGVLGAR